ncbi:O-antigen ligase family protein [uncultured Dokdonia sp.]|uniref:O-antigen ligase family protein n=1 Tax=uncultured Dokdonia sp. TaxID=575653 RepID=UPI00344CB5D0
MLSDKTYKFFLKLFSIFLGILFALIIIPSNAKAWMIISLIVIVCILRLHQKVTFNRRFFLLNSGLYVALLVTLLYTEDIDYGIKKLFTMSSIIIFPIIFALLSKKEIHYVFSIIEKYLLAYIVSVLLFCVGTFTYLFLDSESFLSLTTLFPKRIITDLGKYSIHPIYLSIHLGIGLLFSFYILFKQKTRNNKIFLSLVSIPFIFFLMILSNKGVLIGLFVILVLYVLLIFKKKFLKVYLASFIAVLFIIFLVPKTKNSFMELVKIEDIQVAKITPSNIRYTIYKTTQELIIQSPLLGYGIGDYNNVLLEKYDKDGNQLLVEGKYNAHNQYVSLLLIGGMMALLAFFTTVGINLIYAIRYNNQLLILLLIFYMIVMFTENILERESGIIFFAFFLNFFGLKSLYVYEED